MDERDCLLLQYLFEEKNITKAAEHLYITPAALLYRLRQIEKKFGVHITIKNGNKITITPEGEYLIHRAKHSLWEWRKTKDYLLNMGNEVQGTLRIGVSRVIAYYQLPTILLNFLNMYPKVNPNVDTGLSDEIFKLLQNEKIHLGIVRGDYKWSGPKYLLKKENICIISKDKMNINDLPKIPRINYKLYSSLDEQINHWWNEKFNRPPLITMQVDNYETCKEMARRGLGYAIIPSIFLNPDDRMHTIDLMLESGQLITLNTWIFYTESSLQLATVRKFIDYIHSLDLNEKF
ncbi:LysR family transcriptional regulator [Aneurinibacillus migulanus]|uniref:LysR family transcriptional regulator n=1 Tax=Aneurinibacillus migulanus TaxID=47500 RepID=UPI0005BA4780|nr:LysR family transcriptional regulator [Aneurinibacillus migulanus]KIV57395.1 LysR family transcriptional regulator [Aneurinibacillus migulanus]KPD04832.1 LysR family transcriptional regulator [Aneurinibacillus migulanus]CEH28748.1 LysR family transcriptional regulator [Aneurinibacillus migulanus]